MSDEQVRYGRNGVPITRTLGGRGGGFRTYEIYQRERVGQSTSKLNARDLYAQAFIADPYAKLEILRENYPCYRDWPGNAFWITRYDDVTSLFVDDANFETRPKRWFYGRMDYGRDLREELPVLEAQAVRIDRFAAPLAQELIGNCAKRGEVDFALDFAARYPLELLGRVLDLPVGDLPEFADRYLRLQRGYAWGPVAEQEGLRAMQELTEYFELLLEKRRAEPGDDLVSSIAGLEFEDGPANARDLVITLLEGDAVTLHGALANLWFLMVSHPEQLEWVVNERRMLKFAYLESLRHSPPVVLARRFGLHEVERFGLVFPEGAMLYCSAAAANRDPRVFSDPERFLIGRKDLCQREPRGMYRADGLPSGITFGFGPPTKYPAEPEDRPRSLYAITRDTVVTASDLWLDSLKNLRLKRGAAPALRSLRWGDVRTCWSLPLEFDAH